jgi:hypothetical protein
MSEQTSGLAARECNAGRDQIIGSKENGHETRIYPNNNANPSNYNVIKHARQHPLSTIAIVIGIGIGIIVVVVVLPIEIPKALRKSNNTASVSNS